MRKPEAYLLDITRLRTRHTANFVTGRFDLNHTVRAKLKTAWAGYHQAHQRPTTDNESYECEKIQAEQNWKA